MEPENQIEHNGAPILKNQSNANSPFGNFGVNGQNRGYVVFLPICLGFGLMGGFVGLLIGAVVSYFASKWLTRWLNKS